MTVVYIRARRAFGGTDFVIRGANRTLGAIGSVKIFDTILLYILISGIMSCMERTDLCYKKIEDLPHLSWEGLIHNYQLAFSFAIGRCQISSLLARLLANGVLLDVFSNDTYLQRNQQCGELDGSICGQPHYDYAVCVWGSTIYALAQFWIFCILTL